MSTEPERDELYYTNFNSALLATLIATEAISEGAPGSRRKAPLIDTQSTDDISVVNGQAAASLYQPLQPDEIRLIELQRKVEDNEEVSCSLITVRLEDAPEYTALSYVWGSEEDAATIRVDGIAVKVTQNLRDALATLQMPDQERLMWVDALAINQNDVVERNEQIPRMREIYAAAQFVVIWLGKGDEKLEHLLWMIANVPDITPDSSLKLTMENWRTWCDAVNKLCLPSIHLTAEFAPSSIDSLACLWVRRERLYKPVTLFMQLKERKSTWFCAKMGSIRRLWAVVIYVARSEAVSGPRMNCKP
jgi:hypothetical protein